MRNYKIGIFVMLGLFYLTISCSPQKANQFKEASQHGLNVYLWETTNKIWTNSFENRIVELVERGAEIDYVDGSASDGQTPLLNAAGMLKRLRDKNHHTNEQIEAYELEAVKIVKYLAKKGANIHATTLILKLNALHMAANGGREKMIPVLVKLGLDINSRNGDPDYGGTVLWHAITAGDLATVKAVVEAGADINLCLFDGNSPLDWAEAYARSKKTSWHRPYDDQDSIAAYMQSIGAKHGKNNFKGYLYYDENKK